MLLKQTFFHSPVKSSESSQWKKKQPNKKQTFRQSPNGSYYPNPSLPYGRLCVTCISFRVPLVGPGNIPSFLTGGSCAIVVWRFGFCSKFTGGCGIATGRCGVLRCANKHSGWRCKLLLEKWSLQMGWKNYSNSFLGWNNPSYTHQGYVDRQ